MARKLFGDADPMGRTIVLDGQAPLLVTGILADPPSTSSLRFGLVASLEHARQYSGTVRALSDDWNLNYLSTYVRLRPDADVDALEAQLPAFLSRYRAETARPDFRLRLDPLVRVSDTMLAQMLDVPLGMRTFALVFTLLALGILGLACINFTNLATARSMDRAREIGMRKVLGAHRGMIAGQFLSESVLVALLALVLGVGIAQLLLPGFNQLLGDFVVLDFQLGPAFWISVVGLGVAVGLLAGAYPAFFLGRFQPMTTLKGRLSSRPSGTRLRNGLVVLQFALTAFLIVGTVVMNRQMQFVDAEGFDFGTRPILAVPISEFAFDDAEAGYERLQTFSQELERHPEVAATTLSSSAPGAEYWQSLDVAATADSDDPVSMHYTLSDSSFFSTYGIALIEGRRPARPDEVVLNETAMQALGWTTARQQTVHVDGTALTVVGVAEDVHFASLRQPIRPEIYLSLAARPTAYQYLTLRAAGTESAPVLARLSTLWPMLDADQGLRYVFADDHYRQQHNIERTLTRIVTLAALFALAIALIGLVGITSLSVAQRTKEIGMRKVLGASVAQVAMLLARRFALLVLIAVAVATPLAVLATEQWLSGFAYRIDLSVGTFLGAGALLLTVALLTVSIHTVRAALADPVRSLRYE
jgi:putative ABC transport system permease protein